MRSLLILMLLSVVLLAYEIPLDKEKKHMPYGDIDKQSVCYIAPYGMECYATLFVKDMFFSTFIPALTTNDVSFAQPSSVARKETTEFYIPTEQTRTFIKERCVARNSSGACARMKTTTVERHITNRSMLIPIPAITRMGTYLVRTNHELYEQNQYSITPFFDPDITMCDSVIVASGTYTLPYSLSCSGSGIIIRADNVVLDCAGRTIAFGEDDPLSYGVFLDGAKNITIKNCVIQQYNANNEEQSGVYMDYAENTTIINTSITVRAYYSEGVFINRGHTHSIENTTITVSGDWSSAVYVQHSRNIIGNNIVASTNYASEGFSFQNTNHTSFSYFSCAGSGSYDYGISIEMGNNITFSHGSIMLNDENGVGINGYWLNNSIFQNITIRATERGVAGLSLTNARNTTLSFVSILTNKSNSAGVQLSSASLTVGDSISIETRETSSNGLDMFQSTNNTFTNITITANKSYHIAFDSSHNNTLMNATLFGQQANQIYIRSSGNNTALNITNLNRSAIKFATTPTPTSAWNITLQQYVRLNITDFSGIPITAASSNYTNFQSQQGVWADTNENGLTNWLILNDTIFRGAGGNIDFNNYTITANKTLYLPNTTSINFSYSGTFNIMLKLNITDPPYVLLHYPKQFEVVYSRKVPFWCEAYDNVSVANITVCVYYQNRTLKECKTQKGSGNFTYNQTISLANGNYEWNCTATNVGGLNSTNITTYYFQVYVMKEPTGGGATITYIYIIFIIITVMAVGYWIYRETKDNIKNGEKK